MASGMTDGFRDSSFARAGVGLRTELIDDTHQPKLSNVKSPGTLRANQGQKNGSMIALGRLCAQK